MKPTSVSVRLDRRLRSQLDHLCRQAGLSRSDVVREALERYLALARFEQLRRQVMPFAEARGYLTDEDIARKVS